MNLLKSKLINNLSIFLLTVFFLSLLFESFALGGRWDLNEQIAFSQRLMEGINSYANGQTDLFFPSSPYFPGVGYLSYIYSSIGFDDIYFNEIWTPLNRYKIYFLYRKSRIFKIMNSSKPFKLLSINLRIMSKRRHS